MPRLSILLLISAAASLLTATAPASAQNVTFPMRDGARPETTNGVPHVQTGMAPVPEMSEEILRQVAEFPAVVLGATRVSLPGAVGFQLTNDAPIAQPQAIVGGREFAHLHPDGSLHAALHPDTARAAIAAGWAVAHPWADQRAGWEGFVMIYTPITEAELDGFPVLIKVRSARTYERWIDEYLDPYTVVLQREGLAAAKAKFASVEGGMQASAIGEQVIMDAWKVHVVTLDATREQLNRMTPEQRAKVRRVRRWVIVALDAATRVILGFAFCHAPNEEASLKALRLCFADKTFLLEEAGLRNVSWNHRTPINMVSTDSGSEFGRHPFGGAQFGEAVRRLKGSFLNAVTGIPELRGTIERLFRTFELKWARHQPGWTAGSVSQLNDRKPYFEACMSDDELENNFVKFIFDYNNSPHRGLDFGTPAGKWDEKSQDPLFDPMAIPGPAALREACGTYETAGVSEAGIRFKGLTYSNEFIRNQRMAKGVDRIAQPGEKLEIKFDTLDLGAISVLADGDLISVRCLDDTMRGKSLAWWTREQARRKAEAQQDANKRAPARDEARAAWKGESAAIAQSADVNVSGRTFEEIDRLAREASFGKGQHEKPFIGRDEHIDPITSGNKIGVPVEKEGLDPASASNDEVGASRTNPLDKFRSRGKRAPHSTTKNGGQ